MNERPLITLRQALPDDLRLVNASWYESFRHGGHAPEIGSDLYHEGQAKVITDLCQRGRVVVASVTSIPDEICGWICFEKSADRESVLHYIYVKQVYRHLKIALNMIEAFGAFKFHSHQTRGGLTLARKFRMRYNPYLSFHNPPPLRR